MQRFSSMANIVTLIENDVVSPGYLIKNDNQKTWKFSIVVTFLDVSGKLLLLGQYPPFMTRSKLGKLPNTSKAGMYISI